MKNHLLSSLCWLLFTGCLCAQPTISTEDIDHFWEAYDHLQECQTKEDSIQAFQTLYIDRATDGFKAFLAIRDFTADEYYNCVTAYPKFWPSIRPNTLRIAGLRSDIDEIYTAYSELFPEHDQPGICFAIGTLRSGGTVSDGYLLIGSEIATADASTDKSELGDWLNGAMTDAFDVRDMIAHEYVHALQPQSFGLIWGYLNYRLLTVSLMEGSADFIADMVTGGTINGRIRAYGNAHEAELWPAFRKEMYGNDLSNWLYQGNDTPSGVPADLGYFMGYQICATYYQKAENKRQALSDIVNMKHYRRFFRKSTYGRENGK